MSKEVVNLEASQDLEDSSEDSSVLESEQSQSSNSGHIHGGSMEDYPDSQNSDLMDDISGSSDLNDIVNPAPERLSTVHIRKNLWIPYTGPVVRGKHMMTRKELTEAAFGMDLSGIAIAYTEKRSVLPVTVEVINHQSLVVVRPVIAKEVGPLPESRKHVRCWPLQSVPRLIQAWPAPKDGHSRLPSPHR